MRKLTPRITMKRFEASKLDEKMDKSGKHGKEGSAKDKKMDSKVIRELNSRATGTRLTPPRARGTIGTKDKPKRK